MFRLRGVGQPASRDWAAGTLISDNHRTKNWPGTTEWEPLMVPTAAITLVEESNNQRFSCFAQTAVNRCSVSSAPECLHSPPHPLKPDTGFECDRLMIGLYALCTASCCLFVLLKRQEQDRVMIGAFLALIHSKLACFKSRYCLWGCASISKQHLTVQQSQLNLQLSFSHPMLLRCRKVTLKADCWKMLT